MELRLLAVAYGARQVMVLFTAEQALQYRAGIPRCNTALRSWNKWLWLKACSMVWIAPGCISS